MAASRRRTPMSRRALEARIFSTSARNTTARWSAGRLAVVSNGCLRAYGGVNLGGIWANQNSINNVTAWPMANRPSQFVSSDAWLSGSVPASGTAALLGGGQIGYNVELNKLWKLKFVTGVEADIQGVAPGGSKGTNTFLTTLNTITPSTLSAPRAAGSASR